MNEEESTSTNGGKNLKYGGKNEEGWGKEEIRKRREDLAFVAGDETETSFHASSDLSSSSSLCSVLPLTCTHVPFPFTLGPYTSAFPFITNNVIIIIIIIITHSYFFPLSLQPITGQDRLILEVSRSHTVTQ